MAIRITGIKKDGKDHNDPYAAITSMIWVNDSSNETGVNSRSEMYEYIKIGGIAYVSDGSGKRSYLTCEVSPSGIKYIKTIAHHEADDNLLRLPEYQ